MLVLSRRVEHALDVPIQRSHDADPRKHRRPAKRCDQDQRFHRRLPLWNLVLGVRQLRDVIAGVLQRDERRTAVHRDRFVKCAFPTLAANDASVDLVLKRSKARRAGARSEKEC